MLPIVGIKLKNSLIDVNPVDVYKYSMIISLVEELKWIFLCHPSMVVFFFPFTFLGQIPIWDYSGSHLRLRFESIEL